MEIENLLVLLKHRVDLLSHSDEGGSATQFLQFLGPHICAGGADPAQYVLGRGLHISSVLHLYCLAF